VQRRDPDPLDRLAMLRGRVADVLLEAPSRMLECGAVHVAVAGHLRQDRSGGDRGAGAVAFDHRAMRHPALAQGEAVDQAVRRGPKTLTVTMRETDDGELETAIADDAPGERRRRSLDELAERARTLNGVLTVDQGEEVGTTVRVVLPPYATSR